MDGINNAVPIGSNRLKIIHQVMFLFSGEAPATVLGRQSTTMANATAPIGRFTIARVSLLPHWQCVKVRPRCPITLENMASNAQHQGRR